MARKSEFTPDDIVQAGFHLVDKFGQEHLTARNVAKELGSSTAPVYSNFNNMEELEKALVEEAVGRLLTATKSGNPEDQLVNVGLGVLEFASNHPRWYEALFLVNNEQVDSGFRILEELLSAMNSMRDFDNLEVSERTIVLKKMAIFTHGLATEICISGDDWPSREEGQVLLREVGDTIVRDAFQRAPRSPEEIETLGNLYDYSKPQTLETEED